MLQRPWLLSHVDAFQYTTAVYIIGCVLETSHRIVILCLNIMLVPTLLLCMHQKGDLLATGCSLIYPHSLTHSLSLLITLLDSDSCDVL